MVEHIKHLGRFWRAMRGPADSVFDGPFSAALRLPVSFFRAVKMRLLRSKRHPCRDASHGCNKRAPTRRTSGWSEELQGLVGRFRDSSVIG